MSDDRLGQIEDKLDLVISSQFALQTDGAELKAGQARVETRLETLQDGHVRVEARLDKVEGGLARVETRLDKLEIGQEEMGDQIKQIAEGHGATQAAIERAADTVCKYIDRRIKPLEDVLRERLGAG